MDPSGFQELGGIHGGNLGWNHRTVGESRRDNWKVSMQGTQGDPVGTQVTGRAVPEFFPYLILQGCGFLASRHLKSFSGLPPQLVFEMEQNDDPACVDKHARIPFR